RSTGGEGAARRSFSATSSMITRRTILWHTATILTAIVCVAAPILLAPPRPRVSLPAGRLDWLSAGGGTLLTSWTTRPVVAPGLWDTRSGELLWSTIDAETSVLPNAVCVSRDGSLILAALGKKLRGFHWRTLEEWSVDMAEGSRMDLAIGGGLVAARN